MRDTFHLAGHRLPPNLAAECRKVHSATKCGSDEVVAAAAALDAPGHAVRTLRSIPRPPILRVAPRLLARHGPVAPFLHRELVHLGCLLFSCVSERRDAHPHTCPVAPPAQKAARRHLRAPGLEPLRHLSRRRSSPAVLARSLQHLQQVREKEMAGVKMMPAKEHPGYAPILKRLRFVLYLPPPASRVSPAPCA